jgi:hypothetical protein
LAFSIQPDERSQDGAVDECQSSSARLKKTNISVSPAYEVDRLKKQLVQLIHDEGTCQRLIEAARRRHPHKSLQGLFEQISG